MASCFVMVAVVQAIFLQTVYTQCLNRILPNCQNVLPIEAFMNIEGLLPNQMLVSQPGPLPTLLNYAQYPATSSLAAVEPLTSVPAVIQDNSVANSLAHALQLLVVSNLLSSTLPRSCEPGYYADPYLPVSPMAPYRYFY